MPKQTHTRKPCPGCGEPYWREVDKVCNACATLIAEAQAERARIAAAANNPQFEIASLLSTEPTFYGQWQGANTEHERLREAFRELIFSVIAEEELRDHYFSPDQCHKLFKSYAIGYSSTTYLAMPPGAAQKLEELKEAIQVYLAVIYQKGVERGQSVILGLAGGDISVNEFNQITTGEKKR
jgi:hypothetical protein